MSCSSWRYAPRPCSSSGRRLRRCCSSFCHVLWLCRLTSPAGAFVPPGRLNVPLCCSCSPRFSSICSPTPDIRQSLPKIGNLLFGIALCVALIDWATTSRRRKWLLLRRAGPGIAPGSRGSLRHALAADAEVLRRTIQPILAHPGAALSAPAWRGGGRQPQ